MDQALFLRRCATVQQLELQLVARAVIGPLKGGLRSFNNVLEMLLDVNGDIILPGCRAFRDIRREIEDMQEELEESEAIAVTALRNLDQETERLTAEQGELAWQKKMRQRELDDLETQLESHKSSLDSYKDALQKEKRNLKSAESNLKRMREKEDDAEFKRNVGIGVMFIPIVGLLPGALLAIAGEKEMNQASDAVRSIKREINGCESQMSSYSDKISKYKSLISKAQRDMQDTDNKIRDTDAKLWGMSAMRRGVADIQAKMRQAVHQLGGLRGVGNAAELHTRCQILLGPLLSVMGEMTTALGRITGEDLLHSEGINRLMREMKRNHNRLKQLPSSGGSLGIGFPQQHQITQPTQSVQRNQQDNPDKIILGALIGIFLVLFIYFYFYFFWFFLFLFINKIFSGDVPPVNRSSGVRQQRQAERQVELSENDYY